jgi:hypothetical protein
MKRFRLFSAEKSPHQASTPRVPDSYWTLTADQFITTLDTPEWTPTDGRCRPHKKIQAECTERTTLIVIGITLVLPYIRINFLFGFVPLPAPLILTMLGLVALYVLVTEIAKKLFYSRVENQTA